MRPVDLSLWEAYLRAEYWVGYPEDRILLRVGEDAEGLARIATTPFGFDVSWAYLTAWNPGSIPQMEFVNRGKQEELELSLRGSGFSVLPGVSKDPAGEWPDEEGIFAFGLGWEHALTLGRRFGQNAILAGLGEGRVQLLRC
jgi:hypothetical protein